MKSPDREDPLWQVLDREPFLLVLDGLERILLAYARMDAAQMLDEDLMIGLPPRRPGHRPSAERRRFIHWQTSTPTDGRPSRRPFPSSPGSNQELKYPHTTRLYPTELQLKQARRFQAVSLSPHRPDRCDALNLWREFKVRAHGGTPSVVPLFRQLSFANPRLAGEVAAPGGPGDSISGARKIPISIPTASAQERKHTFSNTLSTSQPDERQVLHTIAAFRMPATWRRCTHCWLQNIFPTNLTKRCQIVRDRPSAG